MNQTASTSRQYFLGIGGQQSGPFSEKDLLSKIRHQAIPNDALLWYEGLAEWQPILSIELFKFAFEDSEAPTPPDPIGLTPSMPQENESPGTTRTRTKRKKRDDAEISPPMFDPSDSDSESLEPVFKDTGDNSDRFFLKNRTRLVVFTFALLTAGVGAFFFLQSASHPMQQSDDGSTKNAKRRTRLAEIVAKTGDLNTREVALRKARSELYLTPEGSLAILKDIVTQNPEDTLAKEAVDLLLSYYKTIQKPLEAGRVLMLAKRPLEASQLFLADPPVYQEAEPALFSAYTISKEPSRRSLLIQDIELLLGPLSNPSLAVDRVHQLEKDFPNQPNPYRYYLKPDDEKISDLFSRISFHFVQSLLLYLEGEFPQMKLVDRPLVEVTKDKEERYRIVGKYKGDIVLKRDRLKNISFVFWLFNETWYLIDTDITTERKGFAQKERSHLKTKTFSAQMILEYLQNVFQQKFPKNRLHEIVSTKERSRAQVNIE